MIIPPRHKNSLVMRFGGILLALLLGACDQPPPADDYFPLQKGLVWEYRYAITDNEKREEGAFTIRTEGTANIDGQQASIRRTSDGTDYYIIKNDKGVFRKALRTIVETEPRMDHPPRMILPALNHHNPAKTWSSLSKAYTIYRTGPNAELASDNGTRFNMVYEVAEQGAHVTVPAGTFSNCLVIVGRASLSIYADPRIGFVDVAITTREWYAPGVGLVKLERSEPLDTSIFKGGTYRFELTEFSFSGK